MGFIVNTNVASMVSTTQANLNNLQLNRSLERLSTGLKINRAGDDASGLAIADNLRTQANSLGQAMNNANEAIGIVQIADKAMAEQVKILDTIKTKATQAAQDGQSAESRAALQADIKALMEQLDNIANSTSYNGKQLLSGSFINKEFQIGADSRNIVNMSIPSTSTSKIGHVRAETTKVDAITQPGVAQLTFKGSHIPNGSITLESVKIDSKAGTGIGALAEVINKNSELLGVRASYKVEVIGDKAIQDGAKVRNLTINGINLGDLDNIKANDADGRLVATINAVTDKTGVFASVDERGRLVLTSKDGRAIEIKSDPVEDGVDANGNPITKTFQDYFGIDGNSFHGGRLTLISKNAVDIMVEDMAGGALEAAMNNGAMTEANFNLRSSLNGFNAIQADAMGVFPSKNSLNYPGEANLTEDLYPLTAGVTTLEGAYMMMDIADSAIVQLDSIRAGLGSAQNQLEAAVQNLAVTQTNVKAAESTIRDVDFAQETANFSKLNILVQSGTYAVTQANAVQQNILKLLQ
jgi:flagellin